MGVKCLAQEHNIMTWPGLEPGPLDPESIALTTRPWRLSCRRLSPGDTKKAFRHVRYLCLHFLSFV